MNLISSTWMLLTFLISVKAVRVCLFFSHDAHMRKQHLTENTTTNIKIFKRYLEASCLIEHSWKPLLFVVVVVVGLELGIQNKTKH